MKRTTLLLAVCASIALSTGATAQDRYRDRTSITTNNNNGQCDEHNTWFGDEPTYRSEEQQTLPAGVTSLYVHGVQNGGIYVQGSDGNTVQLKVCKLVAAENDSAGQQRLALIHTQVSAGDISAVGPDDGRWVVHFTLLVPKGLSIKLEAHNGPIKLKEVNGNVEAHTVNGPISLTGVSGTITATAQNGPIQLARSSGNIKISAQNGPLQVELDDKQWNGEGLDASTHNGPLDLRVPQGYASGVDVETGGHSPFRCDVQDCSTLPTAQRWDRQKTVHIGGSPTVVRLSTVNGPVQIRGAREESQK